jgi:urease accessory protein
MGLFALFQGSAHGAEASADLTGYALGMVIGMTALHASGIGAAIALKTRPLALRIAAHRWHASAWR